MRIATSDGAVYCRGLPAAAYLTENVLQLVDHGDEGVPYHVCCLILHHLDNVTDSKLSDS